MLNKLSARIGRHRTHDPDQDPLRAGLSAYSFDRRRFSSESPRSNIGDESVHVDSYSVGQASSSEHWASSSRDSTSIPEEEEEALLDIGNPALLTYEDAEEQFLDEFEDYFEHLHVDNIRKEQYPKLDMQRIVYLDYANFALFSKFQVEQHMRVLLEEGPNLGSVSLSNAPSSHLMAYVLDTQHRLLQVLNADVEEYSVIFTTGFTAGYRLFGDIYPFHKGSILLTLRDNHESIKHVITSLGLRGGKCYVAPVKDPDLVISSNELRRLLKWKESRGDGGIFVYPAQSCLSGIRHSLNWIQEAQTNRWQVLLDVSTYLPTGVLDLSVYKPEFVLGSLHHMLGYPSGMGFLLVKKQAFTIGKGLQSLKLSKPLKDLEEGNDFHVVSEDDNINLLSFAALSFGLLHLESVGLVPIQKRVLSLATWLTQMLKSLRHKDEEKHLLQVYGLHSATNRGNIVAFNVIDSTGNLFPARLVQKLADRNNIMVGAGYFSNPGLATLLYEGPKETLDSNVYKRVLTFSVVRVSLGPMSTFGDVYRLIQFLLRFRDEEYVSTEAVEFIEENLF